jgi:uncharacterized alkaline shock family protein YloU
VTTADASVLSEQIAAAARSVEGVADLHGGMFGEVGTYFRGGRVAGVRVAGDRVEVHVTLYWGHPIRATADAVRAAVEPLVDQPVYVTVEDLVQRLPDVALREADQPVGWPPAARRPRAGSTQKENS